MTNARIAWLSESEILERLKSRPRAQGPVFVYSSQLRGWTDHALGGLIGIDDHGFHRGDGVFEALRGVNRRPYLLREHFERLQRSANQLAIELPLHLSQVEQILAEGLAKFPSESTIVRLYLTRGPGGFSTSPAECLAPHFLAVVASFSSPAKEKYTEGVRIGKSLVPVKTGWMATTKSLNYLPNVMMKRESLERGLDFTVNYDSEGILAESSTENIIVLRRDGVLCHPPLSRILKGCTMCRLFDLAEQKSVLPVERESRLTEAQVLEAQALFMVGTTLDVLPVRQYESKSYKIHELSPVLRKLIQDDQTMI